MHILVASPSWPTPKTIDFVFVDQLSRAFADLGHKVTVIAPQSLTKCIIRHIPVAKRHSVFKTANGNEINLYRPYYISLGNTGLQLFQNSYQNAVKRAFKQIKNKPDICYGHFWQCIFALYPLAMEAGIPLFGASGEEDVSYYVQKPVSFVNEVRQYVRGVVSVSSKNQQECLALNLVERERSIVIPNAIDQSLFKRLDKNKSREDLEISRDDFVVVFVGQFVPRKGTLRLNEALKMVGDNRIKAIFIGSGSEDPDYNGIIFKGRIAHDSIPKWLNAADVFVLPTENEGCCNAIIEAMACGLPIVSTDAPFNYDILNNENSIMIDCQNVKAIAGAIKKLYNSPELCASLGKGALKTASNLSIIRRAERIIDFININS